MMPLFTRVQEQPNSDIFIEAHIADIHFGALEPRLQYNILKEQFLDRIRLMLHLDIVSINGDIFDHKFMANSDAVMYACMFIEELVNICRRQRSTLIILAGTASHDADQLKLFYHYMNTGVDIRIIEQVQFIYVRNKRILIIPELYNKGEQLYLDVLKHQGLYHACYMHGTYKGSIYGKDTPDLNSSREPIFCMNDFYNCLGPIISGHVHTPVCYDTHFYYCGSPYRWRYGEEEDKGFYILLHNIVTGQYHIHFEPIMSFRYDTINLDCMLNLDPKQIIEYIETKRSEGIDNIRIQFTQNNETIIPIIKSYFNSNSSVKIDANFKNENIIKETEAIKEQNKEYNFIFDKSATPYETLSNYINQQEGSMFITAEDLKKIIEEEL